MGNNIFCSKSNIREKLRGIRGGIRGRGGRGVGGRGGRGAFSLSGGCVLLRGRILLLLLLLC